MKRTIAAVIVVMCFVSLFAFAGDDLQNAPKPAKYIWIQNVVIAEGKAESYPGLVAQYRRAAEIAKSESYWLAATYMTGDMRQATFVSPYSNFAAVEKDIAESEKIFGEAKRANPNFWAETSLAETNPHGTLAAYRDDLSYQPQAVSPADAKWWLVKTIHLAPGHRTEFADLIKEEIDMLTKAKIDEHFIVYEVVAGLPTTGSAFFFVTHMKSLTDMDIDRSEQAKAVFTPLVRAHFESLIQKMVTRIEDNLLRVRPDFSRPPQSFVAANPEFWTVKEVQPVAAKTKGKKPVIEAENIKPKP